jgi:hypothetical protein
MSERTHTFEETGRPLAIDIHVKRFTLSDDSGVFDVFIGNDSSNRRAIRLFACSEQDAFELAAKIARAIEDHALNYVVQE